MKPGKISPYELRRIEGALATCRDQVAIQQYFKTCLFCKKGKYKPGTTTREKLRSFEAFRADERARKTALLHLKSEH